jgi:hypothetical protein
MAEDTPKAPNQPARVTLNLPPGLHMQQTPVVYFNGFAIALGNADFTIVLNLDNAPAITLKCSFTEAKSLAEKLKIAVEQLEKVTNYNLMTADQVHNALMASTGKK